MEEKFSVEGVLWGLCSEVVDDCVVGGEFVGKLLSVEGKDEYLFEEGGVGVFVDSAEGDHNVEVFVVVVLDGVGEGID